MWVLISSPLKSPRVLDVNVRAIEGKRKKERKRLTKREVRKRETDKLMVPLTILRSKH